MTENISTQPEMQQEPGKKDIAADLTQGSHADPGRSRKAGVTLGMVVAVAFLTTLITGGALLVSYDYFIAKKIVTVNLKGYIAQTRDEFLAGKIDEVQMRAGFDRMEVIVKSLPKNRIVLMGDAVIQGVEKIEIGPNVPAPAANPQ